MNKNEAAAKLLIATNRKMSNFMRNKIHDGTFTITQAIVLGHIYHKGEVKISELGRILGLSNSTVSGIVSRLEKISSVERIRSSNDRRVVYVRVTEEFRQKHKKMEMKIEKHFEDILKNVDLRDLEKIIEGMEVINKALDLLKETGDRQND